MAQQGNLTNLNGLVFNKGYMNAVRSGGTNNIEFGALQNIEVSHSFTDVELMGPESLSPLGVGTASEELSGSFECGVITPEQFFAVLGGNLTYNGGSDLTTYTKLVNEERKPFDLTCQTDANNPEITLTMYRCLARRWNVLRAQNRQWVLGGGEFRCYGEANGGRLYTWAKPGNLVNAS